MGELFACCFWWLLLGLFLGFLLFWIYDLLFRRGGHDLIAQKDTEIAELKQKVAQAENKSTHAAPADIVPAAPVIDLAGAKAAGFVAQKGGKDNLKIIEGIGPKIEKLMQDSGRETFQSIADSKVEDLQAVLDAAGPSYKLAKPESWPKQATMCVNSDWKALKTYQDKLINGIEID